MELAPCDRCVEYYGWTTRVYTHITTRILDSQALLINPFGLRYDEFTASYLVTIDVDGNKLDNSPYPINKTRYVFHSTIHSARHDMQCTLHTHSECAEAVSCMAQGLIPMTQTGAMFHERLGYHDYEGIALDEKEQASLVDDLGTRNHGVLICDETIPWVFVRLYAFENAC